MVSIDFQGTAFNIQTDAVTTGKSNFLSSAGHKYKKINFSTKSVGKVIFDSHRFTVPTISPIQTFFICIAPCDSCAHQKHANLIYR